MQEFGFLKLFPLCKTVFKQKLLLFTGSLIFGIIGNWLSIAFITLTGKLINALKEGNTASADNGIWNNLHIVFWLFVICGSIKIIFMLVDAMCDHMCQTVLTNHLKSKLHDKLINMDSRYYSTHDHGELLLTVNNSSCVVMTLIMLVTAPFSIIFTVIPSLWGFYSELKQIDVPLGVICCLVLITLAQPFFAYWLGEKINQAFYKLRHEHIKVNNELLNSLEKPQELIQMGAIKQRSQSFMEKLSKMTRASNRANLFEIFDRQFTETCILVLQILIVSIAIFKFNSNTPAMAGSLVAVFGLIPFIFGHISSLITTYSQYKEAEPELAATFEVLNYEPVVKEKKDAVNLGEFDSINFDSVKFKYDDDGKFVLRDISIRLPGNKTIAIVSHSGGGKSTLLQLLCRSNDPSEGNISLGANRLSDFKLDDLHSRIIKVSQFPLFIQGSLRDNFQLQKADASDEEIKNACCEAGIWDVIMEQSSGEDPADLQLSLGAENFSGGQRRLLAIARAMLKDPSVLLLDEPTTGVDAQTTQDKIYPFLTEYKKKCSIIFVDHNMNFVRNLADMVLVLENGEVAAFGPTEEIWQKKDSLFRKLWEEYNKNTENSGIDSEKENNCDSGFPPENDLQA